MPFLDASAIDADPAGMAFLRDVIGTSADEARPRPSWLERARASELKAARAAPEGRAGSLQPIRVELQEALA